jgi:hypothetical protein
MHETRFSEKHAATPRAIVYAAGFGSVSSVILTESHEKAGDNGLLSIAMARCSHGMRLEELEQECDDKVGRNAGNDHRRDHRQNLQNNAHFGHLALRCGSGINTEPGDARCATFMPLAAFTSSPC